MSHGEVESPWHEGEKHLQSQAGVAEKMEAVGARAIRDFMPKQHQLFYEQLPFILLGSVNAQGQPWATLLEGEPGFVRASGARALEVKTTPDPFDPALLPLRNGSPCGILGIEPHTRRRNRINGEISQFGDEGFRVAVRQTMGNCPKYIHARESYFEPTAWQQGHSETQGPPLTRRERLSEDDIEFIEAADTFYVASFAERHGRQEVDVSHRGGDVSFVRVNEGKLWIPDFSGNRFFNTLGNIWSTGKAGLLFFDPRTGDFLQMTGAAEVHTSPAIRSSSPNAERMWSFKPSQLVLRKGARRLRLRQLNCLGSDA